ncbi:TPM domain-containing protein [Clostridium ganghwense]|uniref:TPM domain-containing protein n=1 Tax=Clostridium ganghwense TaxID=312089 RepID=A0ABT4CPM9_9CLOT|nr:TPM domain-containing protein [Clostridium ganghwense]MCY6371012.1 TPM domain-containing protein [Clostridium ganghwense]
MKNLKEKFSNFLIAIFVLLTLLIPFQKIEAETVYPAPTSLKYVNDYVGILDNEAKEYIVSVGKELEDKTGAQAVIVVVNSLEGNEIRDYGIKLFRKWGIGQKDKDNGLLILMAMEERSWSVEVGRGLEGAIPDILTNRVMQDVAVPAFKKNNFGVGLKNAYSVFVDNIAKEYGVTLEKNNQIDLNYGKARNTQGNSIPIYIIMGLVFLDVIFNRGRIIRFILEMLFWNSFFGGGRGGRGGGSGGGFGGFGGGDSGGGGSSGGW